MAFFIFASGSASFDVDDDAIVLPNVTIWNDENLALFTLFETDATTGHDYTILGSVLGDGFGAVISMQSDGASAPDLVYRGRRRAGLGCRLGRNPDGRRRRLPGPGGRFSRRLLRHIHDGQLLPCH